MSPSAAVRLYRDWLILGKQAPALMCGGPYRELLQQRTEILQCLPELAGRDLVCWCPLDAPCHADVLLELVNREPREPLS
jgi:hypothetical protein